MSSALTSLASVSTMDFVKPWAVRERNDAFYLRFSKLSTVVWAILLIAVAYWSRQVAFVLNAAFSLRGLTSGALLGGLFMAIFVKCMRPHAVVIGMLVSLATMVLVTTLWSKQVFWPWYTLIGLTVTLVTAWLVRQLTTQEKDGA